MEVNRPRKVKYIYDCNSGKIIPDGITHLKVHASRNSKQIPDKLFQEYEWLTKLSTDSSVLSIGKSAFEGCESLSAVRFSDGIVFIGDASFARCISLSQVSLPVTLELLEERSFWKCQNLSVVKLNPGLNVIGAWAFCECTSLTNISIPFSVKSVDRSAFEGCINLVDVCLENVEEIGKRAFMNCRSLCAISIPRSTYRIGVKAFCGCIRLLGVELCNRWYQYYSFVGTPSLVNLSIPPNSNSQLDWVFVRPYADPFYGCAALQKTREGGCISGKNLEILLESRFSNSPIHKLCYHASTTRKRDLVRALQIASIYEKNVKDDYGMTPFHIFATSAKLRTRLLKVLLESYPLQKLEEVDLRGHTMMDYLFHNMTYKSVRVIKIVLRKVIVKQMDQFGLGNWKQELATLIDTLCWNGDYEYRRLSMDEILAKLGFRTRMKKVFFLELALWKSKIMEPARSTRDKSTRSNKRPKADRENCRVTSGATIAIPLVVGFLWDASSPEFSDVEMAPEDVSWLGKRPHDPSDESSVITMNSDTVGIEEWFSDSSSES